MMTRSQRIEYEILDCAINGGGGGRGYTTTVATFMERLQDLFPNIDPQEFTDASIRLVNRKALQLNGFDRSIDGPPDLSGPTREHPALLFQFAKANHIPGRGKNSAVFQRTRGAHRDTIRENPPWELACDMQHVGIVTPLLQAEPERHHHHHGQSGKQRVGRIAGIQSLLRDEGAAVHRPWRHIEFDAV
jgi:hypothetical protein